MKKKLSKSEAKTRVEFFFNNLKEKNYKDVKKIKKLAMSYKIPLKEKRKLFCKKCYHPYQMPSVRINNDKMSITCDKCAHISGWKIK
jgi:RNase P subunit RPR2